jgi:hypothetical protein
VPRLSCVLMAARFAERLSGSGTRRVPPAVLSTDGAFPNGVSAATIAQFVLDHDQSAPIEAVAAHFGLSTEDVAAALAYYGRHIERLGASGEVVRER